MALKQITPTLAPINLAGSGLSNFACVVCDEYLTQTTKRNMMRACGSSKKFTPCDSCGANQNVFEATPCVTANSAHLLDKRQAKEFIWFHATTTNDWLECMQNGGEFDNDYPLYVHCGTYEAALDIARIRMFEEDVSIINIHAIRMSIDAVIDDAIYDDQNDWFDYYEVTDKSVKTMGADAIRYVNRWESSGSISILVDPRKLVQVSAVKFTADDFSDDSSLAVPMV